MMRGRPVLARIRCRAAIVASVPELPKRHNGSPKRRASSTETAMRSGVGWAKCVPSATCRSCTAATIAGWAWPTTIVPNPACRSTYSLPSTSHTCGPMPWLTHTGHGGAACQVDATPPASDCAGGHVQGAAIAWCGRRGRPPLGRSARRAIVEAVESVSGLTSAMGKSTSVSAGLRRPTARSARVY